MRAHYFQHVPFEGLGSIEPWLLSAGYDITSTRFFGLAEELPGVEDMDFLVVMGGPMSANDHDKYPWLHEEQDCIRKMVESGKPVLGVCLGAQLIASALGASVYRNAETEIGWFPIKSVTPSDAEVFRFPAFSQVFHWHGETFDLPSGASLLASSVACRNQAFQLGERVIGLQFHLETTPSSARLIIEHCNDELQDGRFIQPEQSLLDVSPIQYEEINTLMNSLLAYLTRPV